MFKYAPTRYSALLATMGCLRIGTLHDYRRTEHKRGISDPKEGKKRVSHAISSLHIADSNDPALKDSKDYRALQAFKAIRIENSKNIRIQGVSMTQNFDAPDCYVYCLSEVGSSRADENFEGADSCVEITDVRLFFHYLTQTLDALTGVQFRGVHRVTYAERDQEWNGANWGGHPALIKEPSFSAQAEIRAIWEPVVPNPIAPIVMGHQKIPGCCRIVQLR